MSEQKLDTQRGIKRKSTPIDFIFLLLYHEQINTYIWRGSRDYLTLRRDYIRSDLYCSIDWNQYYGFHVIKDDAWMVRGTRKKWRMRPDGRAYDE
jgi:hypothetical protein